jgi:membrane fusion protein, multidrug efflux system
MSRTKGWLNFALLAVVVIAGAAFAYHTLGHNELLKASPFKPKLNPNGTELVVRGYKIGDASNSVSKTSLTGTLQPRFQSLVGFRVAGKIATRLVDVGSRIKKDDLLLSLDPIDFDLQLRLADADVASAEAQYKQSVNEESRLRKLRADSLISQSEYDLALAARDVAGSRLDAARKRVDVSRNQRQYCDLKADHDGLVVGLSAETGQVVNAGQTVISLMQGDELEVLVGIPESQLSQAKNSVAQAFIWSDAELAIPAQLRELSPVADPLTRTFDAKFRLLEPPSNLALGMTATIELSKAESNQLQVPMSALAKQQELTVVWRILVDEGTVEAVPVEVLNYRTDLATIKADLKPGDWIVSAGVQRIDPDVKVRLWSESQP